MLDSVEKNVKPVRTNVPASMDRLPWSRWHWLVVISLGITWILDGLEVTIVGSIGSCTQGSADIASFDRQVSGAGTAYLIGAVSGCSLLWSHDRSASGRKMLFMITLGRLSDCHRCDRLLL